MISSGDISAAQSATAHSPEGAREEEELPPRSEAYSAPQALTQGIRRLVVCLDRSSQSEISLPYGVFMAKTFGSAITLLHVMQPAQERPGPRTTDALGWEISRQEANAYLERFERETRDAGGRVDVRLEQGHPAERILDLVREVHADLVVVGSHGERGMTAWNLGSTVQQVLSLARVSVLVARSAVPLTAPVHPKRILVPLDGTRRTESVLPAVARIAEGHGSEVLLVHVVRDPQPTAVLNATEDLDLARQLSMRLESRANRYLDRLREQLAREVTAVRTRVVRHTNERKALVEIAAEEESDLIVLSAHGANCNPAQPFGSVTGHLLTYATAPVLLLQDLPESELYRSRPGEDDRVAPIRRGSYPPGGN